MNPKRLIFAIVAVFAFVWIMDFLVHGIWLKPDYTATMSLWRSDAEFQQHMGWLMLGQFLFSLTFVMIYAKGFAVMNHLSCACIYGLFMGIFFEASTLVAYTTQPLPGALAVKWFAANVAQPVLMGLLVFFIYKPKPSQAGPKNNP